MTCRREGGGGGRVLTRPPRWSRKSASKPSKISMEGWWMVTMTVRPLRETFFTERMTMAAALASKPAYSKTLLHNTLVVLTVMHFFKFWCCMMCMSKACNLKPSSCMPRCAPPVYIESICSIGYMYLRFRIHCLYYCGPASALRGDCRLKGLLTWASISP